MKLWKYLFGFLILILSGILIAIFEIPDSNLHLIACDVGQGDAILMVYKNTQILTDGGLPNGKVTECLSRHLPFWDREIEVVVNTHPQLDHYGGLIEVFKNYKVDIFVANSLDASATEYQVLKKEVGSQGVRVIDPMSGLTIRSGLISYDIFWPTHQFLEENGAGQALGLLGGFTSKRDPNDFSVQAILSLGEFDALLTGDIGSNIGDLVIPNLPMRTMEYIKVPHHGSKNGLTADYLKAIEPRVAVISDGRNNRYGHPHEEILKILRDYDIKILRTDEMGDIEIVSDGKKFWLVK